MSDIYGSNSDFAFNKLFQLRLERAKKAGLDVSNIPQFEKGGDYALAELLEKAGLPETKGKNEFSWLRQGMESSTASAVIKFWKQTPTPNTTAKPASRGLFRALRKKLLTF